MPKDDIKEEIKDELKDTEKKVKHGFFYYAKAYGDSPVPATVLATLIFPQFARPFRPVGMVFPPVLLFSSYLNLQGYTKDAAGISAAFSALYGLLAIRRSQSFRGKLGPRGLLRGTTLILADVNIVAGLVSYVFGKRDMRDADGGS